MKDKIDLDSLCIEITSDMVLECAKKISESNPTKKKKIMKQMLKDLIQDQFSENAKSRLETK